MAYTTIDDPTILFNTILYTGNDASNRGITGVNFAPNWVWIKKRNNAAGGVISDTVRGAGKVLYSSETNAEGSESASFVSFDSDGYTISQDAGVGLNVNNDTYVGWNWKANGAGSANTDGTINSTVSFNSTSGFSIVSYTGTGSAGTIGHGLGVVPSMIIVKSLASSDAWYVWMKGFSGTQAIFLDSNQAQGSHASYWNSTTPTSSVYSVVNNTGTNNSGGMIAYCFAEKKGFSKFGSYIGNGNTDGSFIYTGFKPAFIIGKILGHTNNWYMFDSTRNTFNATDKKLRADTTDAENVNSAKTIDILSNGFKMRSSDAEFNQVGNEYIYMAFAEEPLVANVGASIPATAR